MMCLIEMPFGAYLLRPTLPVLSGRNVALFFGSPPVPGSYIGRMSAERFKNDGFAASRWRQVGP
jgi:hypothetical protein